MCMKRILWSAAAFFIITACGAGSIHAQAPQLISYQGYLTDNEDTPVTRGLTIEFLIYDKKTGGTALWQEIQENVTVTDGYFSVLLGSVNPIPYDVFDENNTYLALKVGSDDEMTPRKRLVSVGYSFNAVNADSLDGKSPKDFVQHYETNSISTIMIQDDAIKKDHIAPNFLSSLDGVSNDGGDVDLVAGSNVTITPDDGANTIKISASGGGDGDITAVNAGTGLNGGGTAGEVTLNVDVPLHLRSSTTQGGQRPA